eukprot:1157639-Pelagomonas_calceolata.AAC.1
MLHKQLGLAPGFAHAGGNFGLWIQGVRVNSQTQSGVPPGERVWVIVQLLANFCAHDNVLCRREAGVILLNWLSLAWLILQAAPQMCGCIHLVSALHEEHSTEM